MPYGLGVSMRLANFHRRLPNLRNFYGVYHSPRSRLSFPTPL